MPTYTDALQDYLRSTFSAEDEALAAIRREIPRRGLPEITVRPEEGRFLQFLVAAARVRKAVEIGTLGGYSGTWIARGLPPDGRLITLEKEPAYAAVAREHFALAGVQEKIDLRIGNAHDLLPRLATEGPFDFVFVDAEKEGYPAYLDWAEANLVPGGILAAHNAFRSGRVSEPASDDPSVEVTRQFNQRLARSHLSTIYPAGDGTALAVIRPRA
jgi:caffeoyl-CoA O-methyltransferase